MKLPVSILHNRKFTVFHNNLYTSNIHIELDSIFVDEVVKQLNDSGAKYMYTSAELLNKAKEASTKYGKIKVRLVVFH